MTYRCQSNGSANSYLRMEWAKNRQIDRRRARPVEKRRLMG
jgi:hypothetical protein